MRREQRRKKKSKTAYYLYAIVVLLLTIVNITLSILLVTHVQGIQVSGTVYSTSNEIVKWIKEDSKTKNSIYTLWKFKTGKYTLPVYMQDIKVSLSAPWKVNAVVTEKEVVACTLMDDVYVYFDKEGLVMKRSSLYDESILCVEGLGVEKAERFTYLEIENEKIFKYVVTITTEIKKANLQPDKVAWEDDSINLYFDDVCVKLGKTNFSEKISELPPILEKLQGKSGVLQMEHYNSDSTGISFEKSDE